MKIQFIRPCCDKQTYQQYKVGQVVSVSANRAEEIISKGYAKAVRKECNNDKR